MPLNYKSTSSSQRDADISLGNVSGVSVDRVRGYTPSLSSDENLRTLWPFETPPYEAILTAPSIVQVSSTNVADAATSVTLRGVNSADEFDEETILLNGQSAVPSTKVWKLSLIHI